MWLPHWIQSCMAKFTCAYGVLRAASVLAGSDVVSMLPSDAVLMLPAQCMGTSTIRRSLKRCQKHSFVSRLCRAVNVEGSVRLGSQSLTSSLCPSCLAFSKPLTVQDMSVENKMRLLAVYAAVNPDKLDPQKQLLWMKVGGMYVRQEERTRHMHLQPEKSVPSEAAAVGESGLYTR